MTDLETSELMADKKAKDAAQSLEIDFCRRRALPWSIASNGFASISVAWTFSGTVFLLFMDRLGLAKAQIGVVLALIPFCGLLSLFIAPIVSRWGRKRTFISFWGLRYFILLLLVTLPQIDGHSALFWILVLIILSFATCRAVAETACYAWAQEYLPDDVRGRYGAVNNVVSATLGTAAVFVASRLLKGSGGTVPFQLLIVAGCALGLVSALLMLPVPGGHPFDPSSLQGLNHGQAMRNALRDRNFLNYLAGMGSFLFGAGLITPFMPLFVRDELGLAPEKIVLLDGVTLVAGMFAGLLWGWLADRIGSRSVKLPSVCLMVAVPVLWILLPRDLDKVGLSAAALYALSGIATIGVTLSIGRILYTTVVPASRNTEYLALHYAWMGLVGGLAPIASGQFLHHFRKLQISAGPVIIDAYALIFAAGAVCFAASFAAFARVTPDSEIKARDVLFLAWRRFTMRGRM